MKKNKRSLMVVVLLLLVLTISIGYAAVNKDLDIIGNTTIKSSDFDVHFKTGSAVVANGSVTGTPTIEANKVTFSPVLTNPGDKYEFTVVVENTGTLDAKLSDAPVKSGLSGHEGYLSFDVTYSDGTTIKAGDALNKDATVTLKVVVKYRDDIEPSDLPTSEQTPTLSFKMNYEQA